MKTEIFYKGYEAKKKEIKEMGFMASLDKFNTEYPPGEHWQGSIKGLEYAHGEFEALFRHNK